MQRHEAILFLERSEAYIKMYINEIKESDPNPYVFNKKNGIYKLDIVAEALNKAIEYFYDENVDLKRVNIILLNLRELACELCKEVDKKGFAGFKDACECFINTVKWPSPLNPQSTHQPD